MNKHLLGVVAVAAAAASVLTPAATAAAAPVTHVSVRATAAAHPSATPILRPGARGRAVAHAQRVLGVKADGQFGPITLRAVKRFQKDHHIRVTGNIGPLTWKALLWRERTHAAAATGRSANATQDARASAARAAQAKALAGAKQKANRTLAGVREQLADLRTSLGGADGLPMPLSSADRAVLLGRVGRIEQKAAALSSAVRTATTVSAVNAANAQAVALGHAAEAVDLQVGAALMRNPDLAVSYFNDMFDQLVEIARDNGVAVDAAKESAARAATLDALRAFLAAGAPYAEQMWAIDPLSAGGAARIESLEATIEQLPEADAFAQAMTDYFTVVIGIPVTPGVNGLRAGDGAARLRGFHGFPHLPGFPSLSGS